MTVAWPRFRGHHGGLGRAESMPLKLSTEGAAENSRSKVPETTEPDSLRDSHDFSLVLGGPIFQLFRRSHLAGTGLELTYRRVLAITGIAWVPLLLLSGLGSSAESLGRLS